MKFMGKTEQAFAPKSKDDPKMPSIARPVTEAAQMSEAVKKHVEAWDMLVMDNDDLRLKLSEQNAIIQTHVMQIGMLQRMFDDLNAECNYYRAYAEEMSTTFINVSENLGRCMKRAKLAPYKKPEQGDEAKVTAMPHGTHTGGNVPHGTDGYTHTNVSEGRTSGTVVETKD